MPKSKPIKGVKRWAIYFPRAGYFILPYWYDTRAEAVEVRARLKGFHELSVIPVLITPLKRKAK